MENFENEDYQAVPETPQESPAADLVPVAESQQEIPVQYEPVQTEPRQETPVHPQYTSQPQPAPNAYRGAGTGRRESPYANSPYVMEHQPHQQSQYAYQPQYQYQPQTQPPKKKEKKHKGVWGKRILAGALAVILVVGSCLITAASVNSKWENRTQLLINQTDNKLQALQDQIDALTSAGGSYASGQPLADGETLTPGQVYAQCVNSVVAISATYQTSSIYGTSEGASSGSGFILSQDGYVVTNSHVIEGAASVEVVLFDGTAYPAEVIGSDATNDVAVLQINATNLPAVTLGSSSTLAIGDMAVAIGNPLGELTSTQTVGYVSGKDRDVTTDGTIISMIQTDAAINPGNSGGPLFNMRGEVVGITTAKYSGTTNSGASIEGIGFAIPVDDVLGILNDLIDFGYVTGAYLGVTVQNQNSDAAELFGLPTSGAYVLSVESGGAADRAGIQPKDLIVDLGGHEVTGITSLTRALRHFKAGDTTTVTIIRSGTKLILDITLDEKPQVMPEPDTGETMPEGNYEDWYNWFFGDGKNP